MKNLSESKKKFPPSTPRRIWPWVIAGLLLLSVLIIGMFPYGIQWGLQRWLEREGEISAHIEDVDFNPFTGELVVSTLHIQERNVPALGLTLAKVRLDWRPFWKRRMQVRSLSLEEAIITVRRDQDGALSIAGLPVNASVPEPPESEREPWGIGIDAIDIRNVHIRYSDPNLRGDITIVHAHVDPIATWNPDAPSRFNVEMRVSDGSINLEGETTPFSTQPSVVTKIRADTFPLPLLAPILKQQKIEVLSGALNTDVTLQARYRPAHRTFQLDIEGEIRVQNAGGKAPAVQVAKGSLNWRGRAHLTVAKDKPKMVAQGRLSAENLSLELNSPPVMIRQKGLSWEGSAEIGTENTSGEKGFLMKGTASLSGLVVADAATRATVVDLQEMAISDAQVRGKDVIGASRIRLGKLKALERRPLKEGDTHDAPNILTLDEMVAETIRVSELARIDVNSIKLTGLNGWLARGSQGDMELSQWFPVPSKDGGSKKENKESGRTVRIGLLEIAGDSRLVFEDRSVRPTFRLTMDPLEVRLSEIDQAHPQKKSPLEIRTQLSKYSSVAVNGTAAWFTERPTMDLKVKLEAIELPRFTPYMVRHMGYKIESGHLSADADVRVNQGLLDIESNLVFDKFTLMPLKPDEEYEFTKQQGIPLNTALALLRDRDDSIRLRLPVKGDINDPKFGFGHAVRKAAMNAVKTAILVYYAPSAVGKLVSLATALRFEPVEFSPGVYELEAASKNYLDIIAKRLKVRPRAQFTLRGKAVPIDAGVLVRDREELLELAQKRAETVKDYLTSQGGIEPQRLFIGNPEIDNNTEAKPRVEVSF
jgi:outer membrane protein OmpA-like peptidoglycan-associated protein